MVCLLAVACSERGAEPAQAEPAVSSRVASRGAGREGQQQDLPAPGSGLLVRVPIVNIEGRDFTSWWRPEILAADGHLLFRDPQGFPARFNVYWGWDDQQRLWLYNSDDGRVWIYAQGPQGWARQEWERGAGLAPPAVIAAHLTHP